MIRLFPRVLAPLCLLFALNSGCANAQQTAAPIAATAGVAEVAAPTRTVPIEPIERAKLKDKSIGELSGLAASRKYPGLLWAHNDSGDTARIFAINERGETIATVNFSGLEARDWEDIAVAGEWIYISETGDNFGVNENVRVYRVREPQLKPDKLGQNIDLKFGVWEEMTLHYPGGARDAEALAATPDGRLLIISKDKKSSNFYALKRPWSNGQIATLDEIFANVNIGETGWLTRLVTGADLSPDGRELAVVTYAQIYQFDLASPYNFATIGINAPRKRELPPLRQCESVCYSTDGQSLWVSSEGKRAPLWELPRITNN